MPGDRVVSGTLVQHRYQRNSVIHFFRVQSPHGVFTANLQPVRVERTPSSIQVDEYRCFIPISGNRVLSATLGPRSPAPYIPGTIRIVIEIPGLDSVYSGLMKVEQGLVPGWIPRHM